MSREQHARLQLAFLVAAGGAGALGEARHGHDGHRGERQVGRARETRLLLADRHQRNLPALLHVKLAHAAAALVV